MRSIDSSSDEEDIREFNERPFKKYRRSNTGRWLLPSCLEPDEGPIAIPFFNRF